MASVQAWSIKKRWASKFEEFLRSSSAGHLTVSLIRGDCVYLHYQPSYNTSHTMKPSDPMLLADVTLRSGMYPAGKIDISCTNKERLDLKVIQVLNTL